jgi:hypothetical protein
LIRLEFGLKIDLSPQAKSSYDCQKWEFCNSNIADEKYRVKEDKIIEGMSKGILVYTHDDAKPWYANVYVFWIAHALLLGWLYRVFFITVTKRLTFKFNKFIIK